MVEQREQRVDDVGDVAEAAGLRAVAEDGERLAARAPGARGAG